MQVMATLGGYRAPRWSKMPNGSDAPYFSYSATLRIYGHISDLDAVSRELQITPTHTHRRGDARRIGARPYSQDMWSYEVPEDATKPLSAHLRLLRARLIGKLACLKSYRENGATVDIFCGYRTNCDHAGFEVEPDALQIFVELEIPLNVSVIIV